MGVRKSSSCFIRSAHAGRGLRGSSDGRTGPAEQGVLRVGRMGLTTGDLTTGLSMGEWRTGVSMGDADGMMASTER